MKTKKHKILALSGLKQDTDAILKSAATLAKKIDAEVDFFYVKKPTEIVNNENQLSAIRSINREQINTAKELKNLLKPYSEKYCIEINSKFSFGNVKVEIENYINEANPDIIVLGKGKMGFLNFYGDKITEFVLNKFSGPILITSASCALDPNDNLSIGLLNTSISSTPFFESLIHTSNSLVKTFRITESNDRSHKLEPPKKDVLEYVFETNSNVVKNVSNYMRKSNVNLLCIDWKNSFDATPNSKTVSLKSIINNINIPMLIAN